MVDDNSPRNVIKALGGAAAVARELGLPGNDVGARVVRGWISRKSIPGDWFSPIARVAARLGKPEINESSLARMAEERAQKKRATCSEISECA